MSQMKGVDHSEVKKAEESCTVCVSQKARREAGFAVLFSLQIQTPYSWISAAVSQCLFHPYVCVRFPASHTRTDGNCLGVHAETDPGNFWHRGFGWMVHLICSLPVHGPPHL